MKRAISNVFLWYILLASSRFACSQEWVLRHTIIPTGPGLVSGSFGFGRSPGKVELEENIAFVGHPGDDELCPSNGICNSGAVFRFDTITGEQLATLISPKPRELEHFGQMIEALDSNLVLVQSQVNDTRLFDATTGDELATFRPRDFSFSSLRPGAASETTILLMGDGGTSVFLDATTFEERFRIEAKGGLPDIDATRAILGTSSDTAVIVDVYNGDAVQELLPPRDAVNFGILNRISGNTAVVADLGTDDFYLFDVAFGEHTGTITTDFQIRDFDLSGDHLIVGASEGNTALAAIYDVTTRELVYEFPRIEIDLCGGCFVSSSVGISGNNAVFVVEKTPNVEAGPVYIATLTGLLGDFDSNGFFDAADIDVLSQQVRDGAVISDFDMNSDGAVDYLDRTFWIEEIAHTSVGDANFDQQVDFTDFLSLSTSFAQSGGWESGDFDGSGDVAFGDFLLLSENFGQTNNAAASVPEPSSMACMFFAVAASLTLRRRWRC